MYDDYDLEYSYTPEYTYDLDENYDMWVQSYNALDEDMQQDDEYARDNDTYEALAYRHYAWYNTHVYITHLATRHMHTSTKRTVCVTLDVECYDDLPLEDYDWKEILGLEGDENVHVNIKELADVYWLCQFVNWFYWYPILNNKILLRIKSILEVAHNPLRIRSVRGYCLFVVEKFSTLTRHEVFNNEQHNSRNLVHFEHSGIRDRNRS